jgi:GT2 family glycosyltransferase
MTDAVIVVNYRSHRLLARHLAELDGRAETMVIVVDNWSDAAERRTVTELGKEHGWQVLEAPNDGFGAGVNLAAGHALAAGADVLAVLNPDLHVDAATLTALTDEVRAEPLAVVGPTIVAGNGIASRAGGIDWRRGRTVQAGEAPQWLSGACLVLSAQVWRQTGGFDHAFGMYWEDVDLCVRAVATGAELRRRHDLVATHDGGGTQQHAGTRRKSDLYYRANCRGRLVFAARHLGHRGRWRWLCWSGPYARDVVLRGGRRQLLRSPGPVLAAVSGTVAGTWFLVRTPPRKG